MPLLAVSPLPQALTEWAAPSRALTVPRPGKALAVRAAPAAGGHRPLCGLPPKGLSTGGLILSIHHTLYVVFVDPILILHPTRRLARKKLRANPGMPSTTTLHNQAGHNIAFEYEIHVLYMEEMFAWRLARALVAPAETMWGDAA